MAKPGTPYQPMRYRVGTLNPNADWFVRPVANRVLPDHTDEAGRTLVNYRTERETMRRYGGALLEYLLENDLVDKAELKDHLREFEGEQ